MELWNWIVANPGKVTLGVIAVLKWIYNSWNPGTTFPQFLRAFIGEIIQEAPTTMAAFPPAEKRAVMLVRAQEVESGKPASE